MSRVAKLTMLFWKLELVANWTEIRGPNANIQNSILKILVSYVNPNQNFSISCLFMHLYGTRAEKNQTDITDHAI